MPLLPGAEPFAHEGGPVAALLVHGFTGSPKSMRPWADYLAGHGLTVSLPRLPGHGTTWRDMALTRWEDWYAEVERSFLALRERCDEVFVMGLSMGGALAARVAEQHGADVAGLVLVNPSLTSRRRALRAVPLLRSVVPSVKGVTNDIAKEGVDEGGYDRMPVHALASLIELWSVVRADLEKVDQPLLLFRSTVDHVVEPDSAELLRSSISSTDVREVELRHSYHVATLDHDAETIFAGSLAFVRRLAPAARTGA